MRIRFALSLAVLTLLALDSAFGKEVFSSAYYSFYGDVIAIDPHSITIKSGGKPLVFQITGETKISNPNHHVSLDQIRPGDGATVMMKLGQNNAGIAVRIRFDAGGLSKYLKLFAARTISGDVVSGMAVNNFVDYQPPTDGWRGGVTYEQQDHRGVFVMDVRRDGTVSQVKVVKSLGHKELNLRAIAWFKQWRFKPNTVSEVQMPAGHLQSTY